MAAEIPLPEARPPTRAFGRVRLRTVLVIRWVAVAGQAVTVFRSRLERTASPPKKRRSNRQPPAARSAHA